MSDLKAIYYSSNENYIAEVVEDSSWGVTKYLAVFSRSDADDAISIIRLDTEAKAVEVAEALLAAATDHVRSPFLSWTIEREILGERRTLQCLKHLESGDLGLTWQEDADILLGSPWDYLDDKDIEEIRAQSRALRDDPYDPTK